MHAKHLLLSFKTGLDISQGLRYPVICNSGSKPHIYLVQVRRLIQIEFADVLDKFDAILTPVSPTAALKIGEVMDHPLAMYKGDMMTVNINLAGQLPRRHSAQLSLNQTLHLNGVKQ